MLHAHRLSGYRPSILAMAKVGEVYHAKCEAVTDLGAFSVTILYYRMEAAHSFKILQMFESRHGVTFRKTAIFINSQVRNECVDI
jgi:hypothetical protein